MKKVFLFILLAVTNLAPVFALNDREKEQVPTLPGIWDIVPPTRSPYGEIQLKSDGTAMLYTSNPRSWQTAYFKWSLSQNILYLNNIGYYLTWEKMSTGGYKMVLVSANDSAVIVYALKEFNPDAND